MSTLPFYMDYMATTPVDSRVIEKMMHYLGSDGVFGNAASTSHIYGQMAAAAIEQAREQLAGVIHASPQSIIFTSGATESNNLAILGAARFYQNKGRHLITMRTEHKCVLDTFAQLEREGFQTTYLEPDSEGLLDLKALQKAITKSTILVSIMQVNNETGVIQDIAAIGELLSQKGIVFHVDAAQSAGKIAINVHELAVDLMSFSSHKNYGPKGVGALYVKNKPRIRLQSLSFGGSQEQGLRAGTLATHQIIGLCEAFALSENLRMEEQSRILAYRLALWDGIKQLPGIRLNGHLTRRVAGNLNVSFAGVDGDSLLLALHEIALSTKSACTSSSSEPSYVLKALGLSETLARSAIRISLGRFTTEQQIQQAIAIIGKQIARLHEMAP